MGLCTGVSFRASVFQAIRVSQALFQGGSSRVPVSGAEFHARSSRPPFGGIGSHRNTKGGTRNRQGELRVNCALLRH